jgi:methylenetetrahydrofolate reductase (NADPH)
VKIPQLIAGKSPFVSLEFFPPKDRDTWDKFFGIVEQLKSVDPLFCSVTYGAGGSTQDNTLEIATRMKNEQGLEPVVHLTTVGASREKIGDFVGSLRDQDISNVLALRGDPPQGMDHFEPDNEEFQHASDLVKFMRAEFPDMCVGVAGYPSPHPESCTISDDLTFTKLKVDAGADFIMTQLFFDNRLYFDFVERLREMDVNVPVIPGILPILSLGSVRRILKMCGANIPGDFYLELDEADKEGGNEAVRKIGIDFAIKQCNELLAGGAPGVHLYTLNQAKAVLEITEGLDI